MEIYDLLDELEEMLSDSPHIPLTGKVIVQEDDILEFLDRIRTVLPQEIKETASIVRERERIINDARNESEKIMQECRNHIEKMAGEAEIVRLAKIQAEEIREKAASAAEELQIGSRQYAAEVLEKLENSLENTLQTVRQGKSVLLGSEKTEEADVV